MSDSMEEFFDVEKDGQTIRIFLPESEIQESVLDQLKIMIDHPALEGANLRVMPDTHAGAGCVIGLTYPLTGSRIIPNLVGVDIGCGMLTYPLSSTCTVTHSLAEIEEGIRRVIPMGLGQIREKSEGIEVDRDDACMKWIYDQSQTEAIQFAMKYQEKFGTCLHEFIPQYDMTYLSRLCKKVKIGPDAITQSLGTLGSGNHFIEIGKSLQTGGHFITIHCGSRSLGLKICHYHQNKIEKNKSFNQLEFNRRLKLLKDETTDRSQLPRLIDTLRHEISKEKGTDYLEGIDAFEYFFDMIFAQKYAQMNRQMILQEFREEFGDDEYDETKMIECVHNFIDFDDMTLRKGAIRAHSGDHVIIPFNMRDGLIVAEVTEGSGIDWNQSLPHGAGRVMGRKEAKRTLKVEDFKESMEGIYTTGIGHDLLDESPMVYKDADLIKRMIAPRIKIIHDLIPVINVKGT